MTAIHPLGNTLLRTSEMFAAYSMKPPKNDCIFCDPKPTAFMLNATYWEVVQNDYPYDAVASMHMMLAPRRHVPDYDRLTTPERNELLEIKKLLNEEGFFDAIIENLNRGRTILGHYHLHLMQWKRL